MTQGPIEINLTAALPEYVNLTDEELQRLPSIFSQLILLVDTKELDKLVGQLIEVFEPQMARLHELVRDQYGSGPEGYQHLICACTVDKMMAFMLGQMVGVHADNVNIFAQDSDLRAKLTTEIQNKQRRELKERLQKAGTTPDAKKEEEDLDDECTDPECPCHADVESNETRPYDGPAQGFER